MKTKLLLLFGFLTASVGFSQQLTVSPNPFDEDEKITITASGLTWDSAGNGDVYLWAWYYDANGNFAGNPPQTGSDFGNSPETAKFVDNGDGTFSYTFTPTMFYNATGITRIGLLAKSKDGTSQTPDSLFDVGRFQLTLNSPANSTTILDAAGNFSINATSSIDADFQLFANEKLVNSQKGITAYSYDFALSKKTDFRLVATEIGGTATKKVSFNVLLKPSVTEAPVPDGMQDGFNFDPANPGTATFVLFAPAKKFVHLIGNFNGNDWTVSEDYLLKKDSANDRFWITVNFNADSPKNLEYQYVVEYSIRIADPYSTLILDEYNDKDIKPVTYPNIPAYPLGKTSRAVSYIQLNERPYAWQVTDFKPAVKENLVIYEILVRDFDAGHSFKT